MKYLSLLISGSIILLIPFILKNELKKQKNLEDNIIKNPKLFSYIFIADIVCFVVAYPFCVLFTYPEDQIYTLIVYPIVCLPLITPFILLAIHCRNWKVEVFDDYVIYHNLFNKVKIYYFKDIVVKNYSSTVRILKPYKNKKGKKKNKLLVNISCYCTNYKILMQKYKAFKLANKN